MKKSDKIIVATALFFLLFCLAYIATTSLIPSALIAFLLTVTLCYSAIHLFKRYEKTKKIPISKLEDGLAFSGITEQTKLFFSSLSEYFEPQLFDGYFLFTLNCERRAVFCNYKFSPCSKDDISKFYRICKSYEIEKCYILSRQNPREILLFANALPLQFKFVRTKDVRAYLTKHNLLSAVAIPKKIGKKQKKSAKETVRALFESLISKERAKYFLTAGITLALMSVFTPLKIYYASFATIALILAIVCYLKTS